MLAALRACCCGAWRRSPAAEADASSNGSDRPSSGGTFGEHWSYSGPETPPSHSASDASAASPESSVGSSPLRRVVMYVKPYPERRTSA